MLPSAHLYCVGVRVVSFRSSIAHPAYTPVYASLSPSRYQRKTRGQVGSLILTRKNFAFSASCRFIPAHKNRHYTQNPQNGCKVIGRTRSAGSSTGCPTKTLSRKTRVPDRSPWGICFGQLRFSSPWVDRKS